MPWVYQIVWNKKDSKWLSFPMLISHEELKEIIKNGLCCDERDFMDKKKANYHVVTPFESNDLYGKMIKNGYNHFSYFTRNEMFWLEQRFDEILNEIDLVMK